MVSPVARVVSSGTRDSWWSAGLSLFSKREVWRGRCFGSPRWETPRIVGFLFEVRPRHTPISLLQTDQSKSPGWSAVAWAGLVVATLFSQTTCSQSVRADEPSAADLEFFENEIRPLFAKHCAKCHGPTKQWAGLRLDSRENLLKGGDSGPALVPGDVAKSLLMEVVKRGGDIEMPPDAPLAPREVAALEQWVARGAAWPRGGPSGADLAAKWKSHWAFQPVASPQPPVVEEGAWCRTEVDRFVRKGLADKGLVPAPEADRRTLIRRLTYDLTGLPPTPEEVTRFVEDSDPRAWENVVDRLLASPAYGERWGRHWLDVARYSDTKGYVYAREERFFVHASVYRDWVVEAFNKDLPYDRFLLLQIAADQVAPDQVAPEDKSSLAAMGLLTLGRRFLGVTHDIIDDRIDVITRGTMGLTGGCARCHDHKFDPIPTKDYYSLYGVFQNSVERLVPVGEPPADKAFVEELAKRETALETSRKSALDIHARRVRGRLVDYLHAQTELHKHPEEGFDQIIQATDLIPSMVRRFEGYLAAARLREDPVWAPWWRFAELVAEKPDDIRYRVRAEGLCTAIQSGAIKALPERLARAFRVPPADFVAVVRRYAEVFAEVDAEWQRQLDAARRAGVAAPESMQELDAGDEVLRRFLYEPGSPCLVPDEPIIAIETLVDSATVTELWRLQGEVDRWLIRSNVKPYHSVALADRTELREARVFKRGNPATKGEPVTRHFLSLVDGPDPAPFQSGSGRLELARAIVAPNNPLTTRVWANRIWQHHFGQGLVRTPSDFGIRTDTPSHPELLDYLARRLVESGWSTKALHRLIVNSATYRQRSTGPEAAEMRELAERVDPENKLLWAFPVHRLSFEEYRDSLLAVTGELDATTGGRAQDLFSAANRRRTLYSLVDRQFLPGVLRMFDFANPDLHIPQRSETTVPQQALFGMNHPFVAERARGLVKVTTTTSNEERVRAMFARVYQREPSASELSAALAYVTQAVAEPPPTPTAESLTWTYGYGKFDAATGQLASFTKLPHFTGAAWQGGAQWPDAKLGWVQVTSRGGHPGNDLDHASVRRWTAPRDMTITIRSTAIHEPNVGDGVRCTIVSSRAGRLASATVLHGKQTLEVAKVDVIAGETIDFVVDIGAVLNSDQHLWAPEIDEIGGSSPSQHGWRAERDFSGPPVRLLDGWEQLAQVLLLSNELLFVD
jgi:mono/diheme cytochrome c family protein